MNSIMFDCLVEFIAKACENCLHLAVIVNVQRSTKPMYIETQTNWVNSHCASLYGCSCVTIGLLGIVSEINKPSCCLAVLGLQLAHPTITPPHTAWKTQLSPIT